MECAKKSSHFVLVHGATYGGWSWYKVTNLLLKAGHRVSAPDMAASAINPKSADEIKTFEDYSTPLLDLLENLTENEKVVLVGHSLGGFNISVAMEKFPHKISAAVFLTAFMPLSENDFPQFMEQVADRINNDWQDTVLEFEDEKDRQGKSFYYQLRAFQFGRSMVKTRLSHKAPSEDLVLTSTLSRKCPYIKEKLILTQKYESVKRVYVLCKEDNIILPDHQMWIIHNNPPAKVYEMDEADHCPMFSFPHELAVLLDEIAAATTEHD